ncbi:hypothetical protein JDS87_20545 [Bacillus cereus]|uniref:hypothetical protein n=1 Tax=Bacillus cereus TaxID=1396 RepID=UPI0018F5D16A|nr:hypothetical protein [Bacillus cereus]MBJ8054269.1 hypothetical protein [Bacillus cereus]
MGISGIEPLVTVPKSLSMICILLLITCVGMIISLVFRKEWGKILRLMVLTSICGLGLLFLYVTKVIEEPLYLLNGAMVVVPFLFLFSVREWNARAEKK